MNDRIKYLRELSVNALPSLSIERALLETDFYKKNEGKYPIPVLRALNFYNLCKKKSIYIGDQELIVGERGPVPKAVPTFPELTCHSVDDFNVLRKRELQRYSISDEEIEIYRKKVIPYWTGRTQRERIFNHVPESWRSLYEAGLFTEFMEQRAPGHTALDGKIYRYGMLDLKRQIRQQLDSLDFMNDPEATDKQEELTAMDISCDAAILFAKRHAVLAEKMAAEIENELSNAGKRVDSEVAKKKAARVLELREIAKVCKWVPAHAPRNVWEALQTYWFTHLGTITELNGWDAMNPGHLDQHLQPFYEKELKEGTITPERAKELISCLSLHPVAVFPICRSRIR